MGSYVGQRMPRYDSLGHVTGKTQFVDDITLPGMLTIKVRRSPVARAKILNIDTTEAKKCPGVYAVATAKDVPHNLCGFYGDHPVLAENEIRFRGQVIAAVAAIDEDAAMEALSKVKIDLEELTPIFDPREARQFAFFINPRYAIPGLCSVRDIGKPSGTAVDSKATPRNDMKKPHHLPISANCGGESAYFRCMGKLNQAGKQRLSARIRFASANNIFNFAVCFRRPRYRVFRYRNRPFTTPKTCSTFARTDDFSCSLRFN